MCLSRLHEKAYVEGKEPLKSATALTESDLPRVYVVGNLQLKFIPVCGYFQVVRTLIPPVNPISRQVIGGRFQNARSFGLAALHRFLSFVRPFWKAECA